MPTLHLRFNVPYLFQSTLTIPWKSYPLRSLPTSVHAQFSPYNTQYSPEIWVQSGRGLKWVGTEVGIEPRDYCKYVMSE